MLNQTTPIYGNQSYPGGFHKNGCDQDIGQFQLSWQNSGAVGIGSSLPGQNLGQPTYQAFECGTVPAATDSSCTTSGSGDAGSGLLNVTNGVGISYLNIDPRQLVGGLLGESNPCDATPPASGQVYICVAETQTTYYVGATTSTTNECLIFPYDMNPPAAPYPITLSPDDSVLHVGWSFAYDPANTVGDNADHFILYAQPDSSLTPDLQGNCATDGGQVDPTGWPIQQTVSTPTGSSNTLDLTGLHNKQCYDVSVIAFYADGTPGTPSPIVAAAPIPVWDYWRFYHAAGGQDDGGVHCQSAGGALVPLALLLTVLFWLSQRRRAR